MYDAICLDAVTTDIDDILKETSNWKSRDDTEKHLLRDVIRFAHNESDKV